MAPRNLAADLDALVDGCAHVETSAELAQRLERGPLRVKFGVDPTGSELHLGHAVVLHKMQQFVEAGHDVTLLIGDFTALIGDPSGRNDSRPHLTRDAIAENMRTYTEQAGAILDLERIEVRHNSQWLAPLDLAALIALLSQTTVAKMLAREDFRNRYISETPILLHEFLYPVAQAYDSVALRCDVELGGDDQLFNFLLARTYQLNAGQSPQICMTLPILEGTDGKIRMGKSKGNYIALREPPREQFGKAMSIPDDLITRWMRLADFRSQAECAVVEDGLRTGLRAPMDEKKSLAEAIVRRYHGAAAAHDARDYFERTVQRREPPAEIRSSRHTIATPPGNGEPASGMSWPAAGKKLSEIIVAEGFAQSKRAAQRLIEARAVEIDGAIVDDPAFIWPATKSTGILKVGKHRFIRIELQQA